jgi:hypothetical protein
MVMLPGHVSDGAVVSVTVNVVVQVFVFSVASVAVTVIVVTPTPTSVPAVGLWLIMSAPEGVQLSVAVTFGRTFGTAAWQLAFAEALMGAGHVSAGGVLSLTVTEKLHCEPASVHVTVVVPTGKKSPEVTGLPFAVHVGASVVHGDVTEKVTFAPHWVLPGPVVTVMLSGHDTVQATLSRVKQKVPQSLPGLAALTTITNTAPAGTKTEKLTVVPDPISLPGSPR